MKQIIASNFYVNIQVNCRKGKIGNFQKEKSGVEMNHSFYGVSISIFIIFLVISNFFFILIKNCGLFVTNSR